VLAGELPTDLPLVAFTLGDRPEALLEASTLAFDLFQIRAIDVIAITCPVRLRFVPAAALAAPPRRGRSRRDPRPESAFELPFAGVVGISFVGGVITGARCCPGAADLTEAEASDVAASVVPRIEAAGYRPVAGLGRGIAGLSAQLQARPRHTDVTVLVGKWAAGDEAIVLEVERAAASAARKEPEPKHVVHVRIENAVLHRRATAAVPGAGREVVWKRRVPI
jgi:hypothetical protein